MDAERDRQAGEIVQAALRLPPAARAAYLDKACAIFGCDAALRREVESLLAGEDSAEQFIETSAIKQAARQMTEKPAEEEQPELAAGTVIEHYRILNPLGAGGMGKVYLAEDLKLQRRVAIKLLPANLARDAERVRRFEQEALTISSLRHPNIVTIHDTLQHDHQHLIVTEFVEGETLRQIIARGLMDWRAAVRIAVQIASALEAAHAAGIIHRDIKPENVVRQADGLVKVLDFGIAKHLERAEQASVYSGAEQAEARSTSAAVRVGQTETGRFFYTPGYASPEQARRQRLDARTDIFSLGVLLFEMLSGRRPFAGKNAVEQFAALIGNDEAPDVRDCGAERIPAALSAIIAKALRKNREERYASAGEMLSALEELKDDLAVNDPAQASRQLKTHNANRLLTQFAILSLSDPRARIPPGKLWTIWRRSNLKRGELEAELLRRSLRSALIKLGAWGLGLALVAVALAAAMSVTEQWELQMMHDGHSRQIRQIALSPDGRTLVSVGNDNNVIVWDVERRERRATLTDHNSRVSATAFSPDGRWFATASSEGRMIVWDAARLAKVTVLPVHHSGIDAIAFTPDGKLLIAPDDEGNRRRVNLWEVGTWRKAGELVNPRLSLLSPDSRLLVSGSWQKFDLATGREVGQGLKSGWRYGALSPDGARLATVDSGGFVAFWDVSRFWNAEAPPPSAPLESYPAHRDHGRAVAYSPDGRMVATGSENIILWDAATHAKLARFTHKDIVTSLAFTRDSRRIISSHGDGEILVWDIAEKEPAANFAAHAGVVREVGFSPDGKQVASASEDGSIILWDAASGLKRAVLAGQSPNTGVAFSRDGRWLVSADIYGNAALWDVETRARLRTFAPPSKRDYELGYCVAISPDSRWIATTFGVYASADGRLTVDFTPLKDSSSPEIHGVDFSPDGKWLAATTTGRQVLLWEVAQWQLRQSAKMPSNIVAVRFAPDSRQLATGDNQGVVRLWQVEPLGAIAELGRHTSGVEAVAFSPDGSVVASASNDETIALWDVSRRRFIANVGTHTPSVLAVAFSPNGNRLASGEHDKTVRVYTRHQTLWGWPLN